MRRKILINPFLVLITILIALLLPKTISGAPADCALTINGRSPNVPIEYTVGLQLAFDFDFSPVKDDFATQNFKFSFPGTIVGQPSANIQGTHATYTTSHGDLIKIGSHQVGLLHESGALACNNKTYTIVHHPCVITLDPASPDIYDNITIQAIGMMPLVTKKISLTNSITKEQQILPGNTENYNWQVGQLPAGRYHVRVYDAASLGDTAGLTICDKDFDVTREGEPPPPPPAPAGEYDPCAGAKDEALASCQQCLGWDDTSYTLLAEKSWTALGCIPTDPRDFVAWLLARAIGIGGGIAFLLMIWGGFQVITAAGDPDRLNAGKEIITSAIAGLLLIIFSLFLLELIGVDILGLEEVGFKFGGG